jgi:hypothetical protein
LRQAAEQGLISAQLRFATLLRQGRVIEQNLPLSAHYFKFAADQGSLEGQLEYAICLVRGNGISINHRESEYYLRQAVQQGDMRAQMRLGICLLSGLFGRFDFDEARALFDLASISNPFGQFLRDSLCQSDYELITLSEFSSNGSIYSVLRNSSDQSIPLIRLLNSREDDHHSFPIWQQAAQFSLGYLVDLSQTQRCNLGSLPTDLLSGESIQNMTKRIFRMYTIECSLYKNVNHFLRCFPINIIGKFMNELKGILHYIYLLQSSLEYCSYHHPLSKDVIVYRGFQSGGKRLAPLYGSMINEVIVWSSFTSTSTNRAYVINHFIKNEDSILFEIALHPGNVAVSIKQYSAIPSESEILIAASTGFKIEGVEYIELEIQKSDSLSVVMIPLVKLSYFLSWSDFNIDEQPLTVLVEGDAI